MKRLLLIFVAAVSAHAQPSNGIPLGPGDSLHGLAGTASAITYTVFGAASTSTGTINRVLAQGQLATTDAVLYAVPGQGGTGTSVTLVTLANSTGAVVAGVSLAINGTAATGANQLLSSISIPANGFVTMNGQTWQVHDNRGNTTQTGFDALCGSSVAASAAIVNAETRVVGCNIPANVMAAGTTFRITASGTVTTASTPGSDVFKIRIGPTTLTANIAVTVTAPAVASITTQPFYFDAIVTVRTGGTGGTVVGQGVISSTHVTTGAFTSLNIIGITTTAVALDTTVANIAELTFVSGATDSSATFQTAAIAIVKP